MPLTNTVILFRQKTNIETPCPLVTVYITALCISTLIHYHSKKYKTLHFQQEYPVICFASPYRTLAAFTYNINPGMFRIGYAVKS